MGACKTRGVNTGAKYYFNDVQDAINGGGRIGGNIDQNIAMEQRVSLECTLKNVDSSKVPAMLQEVIKKIKEKMYGKS